MGREERKGTEQRPTRSAAFCCSAGLLAMATLRAVIVFMVGGTLGLPVAEDEGVSFLEYGGSGVVSCALCTEGLKSTLNFCKDNDGKSVYATDEVVSLCGNLYEKEMRKADMDAGCNESTALIRSRARVINKKNQCRIVYDAMLHMYRPFDPCDNMKNAAYMPKSVCQSPKVDCNKSLDSLYMPAWIPGEPFSWPKGGIPHTCPRYVQLLTSTCARIKAKNFYARSNLDGVCENQTAYHKDENIIGGCKVVLEKMIPVIDTEMDLCSSLAAEPLLPSRFSTFCNTTLGIPNGAVRSPSYDVFVEKVRAYYEAWGEPIPPEYQNGDDSEPESAQKSNATDSTESFLL